MINKRIILIVLAVLMVGIVCVNTFWINRNLNHTISNWEQLYKLSLVEEAQSYLEDARKLQSLQYTLNYVLVALCVTTFAMVLIRDPRRSVHP